MKKVEVNEGKRRLSALLTEAERGEPTTFMRDGRAVAVLLPVAEAARLYDEPEKTLAEHLLANLGGIEVVRDPTPPRFVDP